MTNVTNPIHLPCPDMAGCVNPSPELTQNSLKWVKRCLERVRELKSSPTQTHIPSRFRQGGDA
ncbi:hypothetical protein [Vibrio sinaloensis]|uniref:hypothetical protein n=1 Tax=Photobacterium sp. (strain ATCC 43367) TaxID=379097 RepID=UPI000906F162|nr:hypothetical protein [Vibrio sinaloensis]